MRMAAVQMMVRRLFCYGGNGGRLRGWRPQNRSVIFVYDDTAMPFIVTEPCIQCKYTDCVAVCPMDCFVEGPNLLEQPGGLA